MHGNSLFYSKMNAIIFLKTYAHYTNYIVWFCLIANCLALALTVIVQEQFSCDYFLSIFFQANYENAFVLIWSTEKSTALFVYPRNANTKVSEHKTRETRRQKKVINWAIWLLQLFIYIWFSLFSLRFWFFVCFLNSCVSFRSLAHSYVPNAFVSGYLFPPLFFLCATVKMVSLHFKRTKKSTLYHSHFRFRVSSLFLSPINVLDAIRRSFEFENNYANRFKLRPYLEFSVLIIIIFFFFVIYCSAILMFIFELFVIRK